MHKLTHSAVRHKLTDKLRIHLLRDLEAFMKMLANKRSFDLNVRLSVIHKAYLQIRLFNIC